LEGQERGGSPLAVAEIPLLYEVGLEKNFEAVVLVAADPAECLRRLVEGRDLKEREATRIMEAQIPTEEKVSKADYVLENNGTMEDLAIRALALLDLLRARARKRGAS
jgi:dephospho-CoA kinase